MRLYRVYTKNMKICEKLYCRCPSYIQKEQLIRLIHDFHVVAYYYGNFLHDSIAEEFCIQQLTGKKKKKDLWKVNTCEIANPIDYSELTDHGFFCRTRNGRYIGFGLPYLNAELAISQTERLRKYLVETYQDIIPEMLHCEILDNKYKYRGNGEIVCLIWYGNEATSKELVENL